MPDCARMVRVPAVVKPRARAQRRAFPLVDQNHVGFQSLRQGNGSGFASVKGVGQIWIDISDVIDDQPRRRRLRPFPQRGRGTRMAAFP